MIIIILLAFFMLSFPVRNLVADYYYRQAFDILNGVVISENTMPAYGKAVASLKKAAALSPSCTTYHKALSEIYSTYGLWLETMATLGSAVPSNTLSSRATYEKAVQHLERAIALEPANADYHMALGRLYDRLQAKSHFADEELKRAALTYPGSAPLRQALAMHYLQKGRKGDALEQARALAKIDDSYILPESLQKTELIERKPSGYLLRLSQSYLYGALEIAWRASNDLEVVKGITPDTPDANQVLQLFLEQRVQ